MSLPEIEEQTISDDASLRRESAGRVAAAGRQEHDGVSLLALSNALLRQRVTILGTTVLVLMLTILLTLLNHSYTAISIFMPEAAQQPVSQLAGLASQFGILAAGGGGDNLEFYAKLPTSRELLRELALSEFRFTTKEHPADTLHGNLVQLLAVDGDAPEERLDRTIRILKESVAASADIKVGSVVLEVTAPWPELAELMNRRVLDLVSEFNLHKRQSHASAERRFVEGRLHATRLKLDSAESAYADFLEQNRRYQESPRLTYMAGRLQRRIDIQQGVYASLAKSYENSRIEEVRNTPVVTVVDPPEDAARRTGSGLVLNSILGIVVGGLLGIGLALIREAFARQRVVDPSEYAEFVALRKTVFRRRTRRRSAPASPS